MCCDAAAPAKLFLQELNGLYSVDTARPLRGKTKRSMGE
jgi:hypothetical protein